MPWYPLPYSRLQGPCCRIQVMEIEEDPLCNKTGLLDLLAFLPRKQRLADAETRMYLCRR